VKAYAHRLQDTSTKPLALEAKADRAHQLQARSRRASRTRSRSRPNRRCCRPSRPRSAKCSPAGPSSRCRSRPQLEPAGVLLPGGSEPRPGRPDQYSESRRRRASLRQRQP
jgi:hypothetical protein